MDETEEEIPKVESVEDVKIVYEKGLDYNKDYKLRQALKCYSQVFCYIGTVPNCDNSLKQYQFDTCLHMCDIYIRLSEWEKAKEFYQNAKDQAEILQDQIKIARCIDRRGDINKLKSNLEDALKDYEESLKMKKDYVGYSNYTFDISNSLNNIGLIYYHKGIFDEALTAIRKSLDMRLQVVDENHVDVAASYNNLGLIYSRIGKSRTALINYNKSLEIRLEILHPMHPSIATTYNNIGTVYKNQDKHEEALKMYEDAYEIQIEHFGLIHADVATTLSNMGSVYNDLKLLDKAREMYQKSLQIDLPLFGQKHRNIAITYSNLGSVYFNDDNFNMALSNYRMSLEILMAGEYPDDPEVAVLHSNIATVYFKMSRYNEALTESIKAIDIMKQFFDDTHIHLKEFYGFTAMCYEKLNRKDEANAMQQNIDDIHSRYERQRSGNSTSSVLSENSQVDAQEQAETASNITDVSVDLEVEDNFEELKEKEYFEAYLLALERGSCRNTMIRAMITGPQYVGKSSIVTVFTEQILTQNNPTTQILDELDKMVNLEVYKVQDREKCDLDTIWNRNTQRMVQSTIENQAIGQYITKITGDKVTIPPLLMDHQYNFHAMPKTSHHDTSAESESSKTKETSEPCRNFFKHRYYLSLQKELKNCIDDNQYAKIWDFGGQSIYHVTHQPFLSRNCIYILVFNIDRNIDDKILTREGTTLNTTYWQAMQEWLTLIIGGNGSKKKYKTTINGKEVQHSLPIFILVASHGDKITDDEEGKRRFKEFEHTLTSTMESFASNIYSSYIIFNCNPNDISESTLKQREDCRNRLHKIINAFVQSLPFMREPIPIRWYIMATILHKSPNKDTSKIVDSTINQTITTQVHNMMQLKDVKALAEELGLYVDNKDFMAMLAYLHDLGEIVLCRKDNENGIIVTNINWLLQIFRAIVQPRQLQAGMLDDKAEYEHFYETGLLSKAYVNRALSKDQLDDITKDNIISLMETYNILCTSETSSNEDKCHYFVPYLLPPNKKKFDLSKYHVSYCLYLGYDLNDVPYIPDAIYYCLLSACLKEWNNLKVELNYQCAKFYLTESSHYIIVKKQSSYIALQYCYQRTEDSNLAKSIADKRKNLIFKTRPHQIIFDHLSSLMKSKMPKFNEAKLRYYVRCADSDCRKLTCKSLDKGTETLDNAIQCDACNLQIENQAVKDWITLNPDERAKNNWEIIEDPNKSGRKIRICEPETLVYDETNFACIMDKIGADWKKVARQLGIKEGKIDKIIADNPKRVDDQCAQMLNYQIRSDGSDFTRLKFVKALLAADLFAIAEKYDLCEEYRDNTTDKEE